MEELVPAVAAAGVTGIVAALVALRHRPALERLAARRWTVAALAALGVAGIVLVAYGETPLQVLGWVLSGGALVVAKAFGQAGIEPAQLVEPTDPVVAARQDARLADARLDGPGRRMPPSL